MFMTTNGAKWVRGVDRFIHLHIARPGEKPLCNPAKGNFRNMRKGELPSSHPRCPACLGKAFEMGLVDLIKEEDPEVDMEFEASVKELKRQSGVDFDNPQYIIVSDSGVHYVTKVKVHSFSLTVIVGDESFSASASDVVVLPVDMDCPLFKEKIVLTSDLYSEKKDVLEKLKSLL